MADIRYRLTGQLALSGRRAAPRTVIGGRTDRRDVVTLWCFDAEITMPAGSSWGDRRRAVRAVNRWFSLVLGYVPGPEDGRWTLLNLTQHEAERTVDRALAATMALTHH
jgi:hypothetical protein